MVVRSVTNFMCLLSCLDRAMYDDLTRTHSRFFVGVANSYWGRVFNFISYSRLVVCLGWMRSVTLISYVVENVMKSHEKS